MVVLHRTEDISFREEFSDAITVEVFRKGRYFLQGFECLGGLNAGEFDNYVETSLNRLQLQQSLLRSWRRGFAFVPSDDAFPPIFELYKANHVCPVSERKRFDEEIQNLHPTYSFVVPEYKKHPIFTRHPLSRIITRHEHPFTELPQFTLEAHPCIMVEQALTAYDWSLPPLYYEVANFVMYNNFYSFLPDWRRPSAPPSSLSGPSIAPTAGSRPARKRRRDDGCTDSLNHRPAKFVRPAHGQPRPPPLRTPRPMSLSVTPECKASSPRSLRKRRRDNSDEGHADSLLCDHRPAKSSRPAHGRTLSIPPIGPLAPSLTPE